MNNHGTGGETNLSLSKHQEDLNRLSRRGMWELVIFLFISTVFFSMRHIDLLAPLTAELRQLLGTPPSPALVTIGMVAYSSSALVLILGRAASCARPCLKWSHLFYRTIFFPFYLLGNALTDHFMGAFIAGLLLIALDHLNIWTYSMRIQLAGKQALGKS